MISSHARKILSRRQRHSAVAIGHSPILRQLRCEQLEFRHMLAGITVNTVVDELDGSITDGDVSLRDAIAMAAPGDVISFHRSLSGQTLRLSEGELTITRELTIDASALADRVTIDASGNDPTPGVALGDGSQVLVIDDGLSNVDVRVVLRNLVLTGADAPTENGQVPAALESHEALEVYDSQISNNFSKGIDSTASLLLVRTSALRNTGTYLRVVGQRVTITESTIGGLISLNASEATLSQATIFGLSLVLPNVQHMTVALSTLTGPVALLTSGSISLESSILASLTIYPTLSPAIEVRHSLIRSFSGSENLLSESQFPDDRGNLIGGPIGGPIDPMLGPLGDNGGPTPTYALLPESPAINAGNPEITLPNLYDQRGTGYYRIVGGRPDMGATEVQRPMQLADVNDSEAPLYNPYYFLQEDDIAYVIARGPIHGTRLWKLMLDETGHVYVNDGPWNAWLGDIHQPAILDGTLYFMRCDDQAGQELWRSDGLESGTYMVRDIRPGAQKTCYNYYGEYFRGPRNLTKLGHTLLFTADDGIHGRELWRTDGTAQGTFLVKDINPNEDTLEVFFEGVTVVDGVAYFTADDGTHGRQLWRTDGTTSGTYMIGSIGGGDQIRRVSNIITNVNGTLYFSATSASGAELWKSNGTSVGTMLVKDIAVGAASSYPGQFTHVNGTLFFTADDKIVGRELWSSQGTPETTRRVADIQPGIPASMLDNLTAVGGELFFTARDPELGTELWKSDGTDEGTRLVKNISLEIGATGPRSSEPRFLTDVDGTLYFTADDGVHGRELWQSDGTDEGTVLVREIANGGQPTYFGWLEEFGTKLVFAAGPQGDAYNQSIVTLWQSDGTEVGTFDRGTKWIGTDNSTPLGLTIWDRLAYFSAYSSDAGRELWRSDGTIDGTHRVADIAPGSTGSVPEALTSAGHYLYFVADDGVTGRELWVTDGSLVGTRLVLDIESGMQSSNPENLTTAGGRLFFTAETEGQGRELWVTDGSQEGTQIVSDIVAGDADSNPRGLTYWNGMLYFAAHSEATGRELWWSDGTEAGTAVYADIWPGPQSAAVANLTVVDDSLYFSAADGVHGYELWKTDANAMGVHLVKDIFPGETGSIQGSFQVHRDSNTCGDAEGSILGSFQVVAQTLYFVADDGMSGRELWKSNGTESGTRLVRDINTGTESAFLRNHDFAILSISMEDVLFFLARDNTHAFELWRSDGTTEGTKLVRDIHSGVETAFYCHTNAPASFDGTTDELQLIATVFQGQLYFRANDGVNGAELWATDRQGLDASPVRDFVPGGRGGDINGMAATDELLYFGAASKGYGFELWTMPAFSTTDFNVDGVHDSLDIDVLMAVIADHSDILEFDLTRDGTVDKVDRDAWLQETGMAELTPPRPFMLGDVNLDGEVDAVDFDILRAHLFESVTDWTAGNLNGDSAIDGSDFNLWYANRFVSTASAAAPTKRRSTPKSAKDTNVSNIDTAIQVWRAEEACRKEMVSSASTAMAVVIREESRWRKLSRARRAVVQDEYDSYLAKVADAAAETT